MDVALQNVTTDAPTGTLPRHQASMVKPHGKSNGQGSPFYVGGQSTNDKKYLESFKALIFHLLALRVPQLC